GLAAWPARGRARPRSRTGGRSGGRGALTRSSPASCAATPGDRRVRGSSARRSSATPPRAGRAGYWSFGPDRTASLPSDTTHGHLRLLGQVVVSAVQVLLGVGDELCCLTIFGRRQILIST